VYLLGVLAAAALLPSGLGLDILVIPTQHATRNHSAHLLMRDILILVPVLGVFAFRPEKEAWFPTPNRHWAVV